jgi:hypothetical protein
MRKQSEYYMVRDSIWKRAGDVKGYLCIGCLEKRLGRRLTPRDFADVPCNDWIETKTPRLVSRMVGRRRLRQLVRQRVEAEFDALANQGLEQ